MRPRLLLGLMFASSLGLWVAVPLLWLFVAGRVQGATGSLGLAVVVALVVFGVWFFVFSGAEPLPLGLPK